MEANVIWNAALEVASVLKDAGYTSYFAGGCVRDRLLGREAKDVDIATNATPAQVTALFPKAQQVGAHFGVVIVPFKKIPFEIATFRTDGSYADGRRPDAVTFSTPAEDAQRRDFTVNGLFFDPVANEVVDFVGGQADLQTKTLRAIGNADARFSEDFLRLLRAVRFATTLDFEIEPTTWQAIVANAHGLAKISQERITAEFSRMMLSTNRVKAFDLLVSSGLMKVFLPEILDLQGCEQPPQWHPEGDVFTHTRLMLKMAKPDASLPLILAILLHDIAKPATQTTDPDGRIRFNGHDSLGACMAESILRRMKFPNQVVEDVVEMVARHMQYMNVQDMRTAKLKRFMARPTFAEEMELHRVDCASSNGCTANHDFLTEKQRRFAAEPLIPSKLIDGRELMRLGYPAGRNLGLLLLEIQTQQLEGKLTTAEEAAAWALATYPPGMTVTEAF